MEQDAVRVTCIRVANFRSLQNVELNLGDLTVLIGANNAGKSTFLDALYMALGVGRKVLGQEDIFLTADESLPPKERKAVVDVLVRPLTEEGTVGDKFPPGSYWTSLWGGGISQDGSFHDFMGFRSTLSWDLVKGEYSLTKKFLKEWLPFDNWAAAEEKEEWMATAHIEPISLYYIDAQRDLDDDLRRPGSFWRRLTDDLGLAEADVTSFEEALANLNKSITDKSEVLKHLKENLVELEQVVAADGAGIEIAPVAKRLRDLSRGIDVSFSSGGSQPFPLTRHGMGTRSLASLLVFRAFVSWKTTQIKNEGNRLHAVLALEEPEAHLHPHAQRALYTQIRSIAGQRLVSTHSPYFAGQADLAALRLFLKKGTQSTVRQLDLSQLESEDRTRLERMVVATRGDLLFSRAIVVFEGDTEEQALPIWAEGFWGASVHELGFSFVGIGGGHYFPFIWLAKALGISWYVFSDGETHPVATLVSQLKRAGVADPLNQANVIVLPDQSNLEKQLIAEGYTHELEGALESAFGKGALDNYIADLHGQKRKGGGIRDYQGAEGRQRALLDMLEAHKTRVATHVALAIRDTKGDSRKTPQCVLRLLKEMTKEFDLKVKSGKP